MSKFKLSDDSLSHKGYISDSFSTGVMANTKTGEIVDKPMVSFGSKLHDKETFIKLYTDNLDEWFIGLSKSALLVLSYIMTNLHINKDSIYINPASLLEKYKCKSRTTVYNGIAELIKKKVISKDDYSHKYYVNLNYFYNGNRLKNK